MRGIKVKAKSEKARKSIKRLFDDKELETPEERAEYERSFYDELLTDDNGKITGLIWVSRDNHYSVKKMRLAMSIMLSNNEPGIIPQKDFDVGEIEVKE